MWSLLDDEGPFPSDARTTLQPAHPETSGASVLPLFGTPEDDGLMGWQERALCAQTDPEAFFPEKGGSTREAKKVCTGCDVRAECLEYALANDERFGIWGGLSERERRKLKRRVV
jgi:WhiB family transcriptional regulator, redox-sensing transcriptional regulator